MLYYRCPDCGEEIHASRLEEINKEREEKGISIRASFVRCKGTGKHITGVIGRVYSLTEKGKKALEVIKKLEELSQSSSPKVNSK